MYITPTNKIPIEIIMLHVGSFRFVCAFSIRFMARERFPMLPVVFMNSPDAHDGCKNKKPSHDA